MHRRASLLTAAFLCALALVGCEISQSTSYPCPEGMDCSGKPPVHVATGTSTVGGACQVSGDCASGTCVTTTLLYAMGVDTTYIDVPNGMCSRPSCTSDNDCGDGGVCQDGTAFGNSAVTLCLRRCENITNCRWKEGYSCWVQDPVGHPAGVCLPDSVIAATYCPTGCP
jgi:hypothetical protein